MHLFRPITTLAAILRCFCVSYGLLAVPSLGSAAQTPPEGYRETTIDGTTHFGLDPSWADGREFETAFDGDADTFYDYRHGDRESFVGMDHATAVVPTAIHFVARYGRTDRMEGGRFEGSNESSVSGYVTLHEITERPADGPQVVELSTDQAYRYYRYVSPAGSYGNIAEFSIEGVAPSDSSDGGGGEPVVEEESDSGSVEGFAQTEVDGRMIFGLDPAWAEGREFDKVFDGDPDTFYDYLYGEEASFVGFDNGVAERPVQIRFSPRSSGRFPERMIGGKFQGSNESVHSGYVTLHEVSQTPASSGETVELTVAESYRYYRYLAPAGSFGNIAEFTVSMADETQVSEPEPTPEPNPEPTPDPAPEGYRESGIHFGLDPVWREGRGFEAVFDGDPDTYYDFRYSTRSSYVGIDKTEAFVPAEIRYTPRKGWAARILGGRFQGSNESRTSGYETIHMVITFTDDGEQVVQLEPSEAYRYYRYLAPAGSYGNIAEFDVLSAEEAAAESEASEPDTETEPVETEPEDDGSGEPGGDPAEPGDEDSAADLPTAIAVDGVRDLGGNGVEISFSLPEAGKVSAAVFNAYGQQVRTLAMGEEYEPGTHAMLWDGLDRNGRPVPAGEYSFKLLRSDGFTARYVANLGINPGSASYDTWVGNHDGGASVAVDSSGVYIAGQITETAPVLIKQSFDGSTRHWEKTRMDVTDGRFQGGISLASNGQGTVYMLQQNGRLQVIDADSGYKKASWDVLPSGVSRSDERYELIYEHLDGQVAPADMSAQGNYLVLSFRDANKLVWLNPANGSVIKEYGMTAPLGVAVNAAGEVYVIRDNRIFRIVDSSARVVVDSNLDAPQRIDYDASNDTLLVVDGIEGGTVKRFSLDGELLARHGRDGGRLNGSYVAEDFHAVRDITADGQGGFFVSEPNSPPRRIAHVDGDGTILNEWFGGQNYYAWAEPDPKEKGEVWINSGNGLVLVDLDFETGDWDVVESYILDDLAGGLISAVGGHQGMWQVVYDGDQRYLISEFVPQVLYHEPGALHGVSVTSNHTDQLEFAKQLTGYTGSAGSFRWLDKDGDGRPQPNEFEFSHSQFIAGADHVHSDFSLVGLDRPGDTFDVVRTAARWSSYGPYFPFADEDGKNEVVASTPVAVRASSRGAGAYASADGDFYGHYNLRRESQGLGWPTFWASISRFVKWDAQGRELWSVGRHAYHGGLAAYMTEPRETPAGQMHVPLKVIGEVGNTVVLTDRVETPGAVWTKDGLYAGSVLDHRTEDGLPDEVYAWWQTDDGKEAITTSDNASGGSIVEYPDGSVYLFTQGRNSVPVYEITGWASMDTVDHSFSLASTKQSAAAKGSGLVADYYAGYFDGSRRLQRTESRIWHGVKGVDEVIDGHQGPVYDWSSGPEGLGMDSGFSARWVGEIEAPLSEDYTFSVYARGGARLWIDGELVLNYRSDLVKRSETTPISLVAGERYHVQLEFDTADPDPAVSLNWESRNIDRERVPMQFLYPVASGNVLQPVRDSRESIIASSFDHESGHMEEWLIDETATAGLRQRGFGKSGAYLGFENIVFDGTETQLEVRAAASRGRTSETYPIRIAFRLGSPDGPEIAELDVVGDLTTLSAEISTLSGEQTIYAVNTSGDDWHSIQFHGFSFK